jgi:hypothetical protein
MKKSNLIIMGTLAMALALGLVLAGCDDDSDSGEGGGGTPAAPPLSDFKGTYTNGAFVPGNKTSLTVTEDSLEIDGTEIEDVTTSAGGSTVGGGSWVYLIADDKKIGIIVSIPGSKSIFLGKAVITSAKTSLDALGVDPVDIKDGEITGTGMKSD